MKKINNILNKYFDKLTEKFGLGFYHDPIMLTLISIFTILVIALIFMIVFRVQLGVVETPLLYNVVSNVTFFGPWYYLYYYLLAIVLVGLLNLLIAWSLFDKERLLSYLLGISNVILTIVMILFVYNLTALI
ncbi:MAG: hypothetical protein WCP14_04285 [bacterium]